MPKLKTPELTDADWQLLAHGRMLRAMGVDPAEFLGKAGFHEMRARDVKPFDPARAIARTPSALYAPSILDALWAAAMRCTGAPTGAGRRRPEVRSAVRMLRAVSRALLAPSAMTRAQASRARAEKTLGLAREIADEADAVGEMIALEMPPAEIALRRVARRYGLTPAALSKRIERAKKEFPSPFWPKKKARRF